MRRLRVFSALLASLLISGISFSQTQGVLSKKWYGNWSVGVGGGPTLFYGDLNPWRIAPGISTFNEIRYAGSFYLIRQLSHVFALRGQALYGEIYSMKRNFPNGTPCNEYLIGNIFEYNLNTTINFSNLILRYKPKRIFFIYGTVGIGMSNWITKVKDANTNNQLRGSGSPSNWTTEWVVPAGLGAYFNIYDKVNLGVEWTLRGVNSDRLDATVGGFQYDLYSFLSLNLVYNFNRRNPVKLDAVNATMPPVVLPKANPPVESTTPGKHDTISAAKAGQGQPVPISTQHIMATPSKMGPDSSKVKEVVPGTKTTKPYQLPGLQADVFYRVQIFASSTGQRSAESIRAYFKLTQPVYKELSEGYYRYYVGEFEKEAEANQLATSLQAKPGLSKAFIVKFINGTRELTHPK
ncbi:MAG: hypothetical protein D4R67_01150 [Bacteroidetes bacterium]|nr:MAG: hypothetical protein D4R67_01150 [Bacteroidota bacterium]